MGIVHQLQMSNRKKGTILFVTGLVSLVVMAILISTSIGDEDFFYVTKRVHGVTTYEYSPRLVIGMLILWGLTSALFVGVGLYLAKNKKKGMPFYLGGSLEIDSDSTIFNSAPKIQLAKLLPKVFISIGALCLLIGGGLLVWDRISLLSLIETEAIVTERYHVIPRSSRQGSSSKTTYYAKLEYEINGKYYKSQITTSMFFHDSQITVYCNPQNPVKCRTNDEYMLWYLILFPIGIGFSGTGLFLNHKMKKEEMPPE